MNHMSSTRVPAAGAASTETASAAGGWSLVSLIRKTQGCTVIAHISDLHLEYHDRTDGERWTALRESLTRYGETIDLLVVTGDLIELPGLGRFGRLFRRFKESDPSPTTVFQKVRKYLLDLCEAAEVDPDKGLLVVPGNHDVRRIRGAGWFDADALTSFRQVFRNEMPICRLYPDLEICFFLFDSNPREKFPDLAAGYVYPNELIEFAEHARSGPDLNRDAWRRALKIALVHHHPMPIGPTQSDSRQLIGGEPYMVLKNSGVFMQEVLRADVDLVLHGHRHYPSLSRAAFHEASPENPDKYRSLSVIAAGSVGKADDYKLSYNLIKVDSTGEVSLTRFCRTNATYKIELPDEPVISYVEARLRRIFRRAHRLQPLLRVQAYTCHWDIRSGSGDSFVSWTVEDATSYGGKPVSVIPREFSSLTGYFHKPAYESSQGVNFEWTDRPMGEVTFSPPISEIPVTYKAQARISNAYHFNRQDRRDATDDRSDRESAAVATYHFIGTLTMSVTFPEGHFPGTFQLEALQLEPSEEKEDPRESRYASALLAKVDSSRTVTFLISDPLPGYRYRICWDLPPTELQEIAVTDAIWNRTQEARVRLRSTDHARPVKKCLQKLSHMVSKGEPADIALFVHDDEARGLISCSTAGSEEFEESLSGQVVKMGRTLVGQAYRRRQTVISVAGPSGGSSEFYFEPQTDPATLHENRTAILAMPLFYPMSSGESQGIRVAVLWLGTSSRLSALIQLNDDTSYRDALINLIAAWYSKMLLPALGLMPEEGLGKDEK